MKTFVLMSKFSGHPQDKPKDLDEYRDWLKSMADQPSIGQSKIHYDSVCRKVIQDFERFPYWMDLLKNLHEYDEEYLLSAGSGYHLFQSKDAPELSIKPFESFIEKTYRKNIMQNKLFPSSPQIGWYLFDNWYTQIHDIIRTRLVVKYLDGVDFLSNKLNILAKIYNLHTSLFKEAREDGYYAAHFYVSTEFEIPDIDFNTKKINMTIEIQITTQLQEVIQQLIHKYYEKRRIDKEDNLEKLKWDYKSEDFIALYLGHILHYVEGMIMEVKTRQSRKLK